jgi:hypothetical protein
MEQFRHGKLTLMPCGGADSSDPKVLSYRVRRVSWILPLPIKTNLPVSVNGHFRAGSRVEAQPLHDISG